MISWLLIWIYTVYKGKVHLHSAGLGLTWIADNVLTLGVKTLNFLLFLDENMFCRLFKIVFSFPLILGLATLGRFSAIFYMEDNFCDFLFATNPFEKGVYCKRGADSSLLE